MRMENGRLSVSGSQVGVAPTGTLKNGFPSSVSPSCPTTSNRLNERFAFQRFPVFAGEIGDFLENDDE